jgi:hypothetical protein
MRTHCKTLLLALWLLSRTLSFALPGLLYAGGQIMPPCPVWVQNQPADHDCDAGFQPSCKCQSSLLTLRERAGKDSTCRASCALDILRRGAYLTGRGGRTERPQARPQPQEALPLCQ